MKIFFDGAGDGIFSPPGCGSTLLSETATSLSPRGILYANGWPSVIERTSAGREREREESWFNNG